MKKSLQVVNLAGEYFVKTSMEDGTYHIGLPGRGLMLVGQMDSDTVSLRLRNIVLAEARNLFTWKDRLKFIALVAPFVITEKDHREAIRIFNSKWLEFSNVDAHADV